MNFGKHEASGEIETQLRERRLMFNPNFMGGDFSRKTVEMIEYENQMHLDIAADEVLSGYPSIPTLAAKVAQWIADQIKYAPEYLTEETARTSGFAHQETKNTRGEILK